VGGFPSGALRRLLLGGGPPRFGPLDALFFCAAPAPDMGLHHRYNSERGQPLAAWIGCGSIRGPIVIGASLRFN